MTKQTTLLLATSLALSTFGCGGGDDGGGGGATTGCTSMPVTTSPQAMECKGASVVANEANNYRFTSEIKLPTTTVKSMTNLKFDWSAVTKDFLGHPLNPAGDIDIMVLLMWQLSLTELEQDLNADALQQIDLRSLGVAQERRAPGDALVEHVPRAVEVRGGAIREALAAEELARALEAAVLRREVGVGAHDLPAVRDRVCGARPGDAEVHDDGLAVGADEHVL